MWTDLLDECVRSVGAEQQDGSAQCVSVAIELLGPHGGEEVGKDFTDVPVHPLQGHVHALTGGLVQKTLQAANIWRNGKRKSGQKSNLYHCKCVINCRDISRRARTEKRLI